MKRIFTTALLGLAATGGELYGLVWRAGLRCLFRFENIWTRGAFEKARDLGCDSRNLHTLWLNP